MTSTADQRPATGPGRLAGRTVLIAGAAGGQGRAGAVLFARQGANLALCDIDEVGLETTQDAVRGDVPGTDVLTARVDMRDVAAIERFAAEVTDRFGVIDVVYNNAGINHVGALADASEEDFERVHDINLKSAFFLVKAALPGLKRSTSASIIIVSSGAGLLAPADGNALYCSSKGGLISLTRALARDLAPLGIRVNCLLPGPIETPMVHKFFAAMPAERQQEVRDEVLSRSLFKRFGQPEEVAAMAVFLATDEATYVTAGIIPVDAGWIAV
ncbi:MAG: oxidoreductase [Pseudonocardiales bacterium]|nr:oxidoreductase [Pseudonocardiales bacterium]